MHPISPNIIPNHDVSTSSYQFADKTVGQFRSSLMKTHFNINPGEEILLTANDFSILYRFIVEKKSLEEIFLREGKLDLFIYERVSKFLLEHCHENNDHFEKMLSVMSPQLACAFNDEYLKAKESGDRRITPGSRPFCAEKALWVIIASKLYFPDMDSANKSFEEGQAYLKELRRIHLETMQARDSSSFLYDLKSSPLNVWRSEVQKLVDTWKQTIGHIVDGVKADKIDPALICKLRNHRNSNGELDPECIDLAEQYERKRNSDIDDVLKKTHAQTDRQGFVPHLKIILDHYEMIADVEGFCFRSKKNPNLGYVYRLENPTPYDLETEMRQDLGLSENDIPQRLIDKPDPSDPVEVFVPRAVVK
jgi:hypothetical protein